MPANQHLNIFGANQTTPGAMTNPSNMNTDTAAAAEFLIVQGSGATAKAFQILSKDGSTVIAEHDFANMNHYGMKVGCAHGVTQTITGLDGTVDPPCVILADGTNAGQWTRIWGGTGSPPTSTGSTFAKLPTGTPKAGDWYLQKDGGAGSRWWICKTNNNGSDVGAWTAIA